MYNIIGLFYVIEKRLFVIPRPSKSLAEKMEIINAKIKRTETQLRNFKDERKNLVDIKNAHELSELIVVMKEKNISIDQVKNLIQ